ncbi:hypothetical protein QYF36_011180 [Acer negundo]|nr:hypothetical protein QYF36_011180 [Acer negundo]
MGHVRNKTVKKSSHQVIERSIEFGCGGGGARKSMQDGLGDTIKVSFMESPEEEIDPCRRLANLGMRAADSQQGVGEEVDYRGVLHRDGLVLMSVSLDQLKVTTWQFTRVEWRDCNYMYYVTNL